MFHDWSRPLTNPWTGFNGPPIDKDELRDCVAFRIVENRFYPPGREPEFEWVKPLFTPQNPFAIEDGINNRATKFIPGLHKIPSYPQLSTLSRDQHFKCLKVLATKYNVQPKRYPKATEEDYNLFEEIKEMYEKEQQEYIKWAKQCWINGDCIRTLRPNPIIEKVYDAQYKLKTNELHSLPMKYTMAAQIPLETRNGHFVLHCQKDLICVDIKNLPTIEYPEEMTEDFSVLKEFALPEPCKVHPCRFVLPNEKAISVLPLTEIHRELANYAIDNDAAFIASENALQCLLETERSWKLPLSVVEVISPEGDTKNVVVLGSEFSILKENATQRTFKAYKHLLRHAFTRSTDNHYFDSPNNQAATSNSVNDDSSVSSDDEGLQVHEINKNPEPTAGIDPGRIINVNKPNYSKHKDTNPSYSLRSANDDLDSFREDDKRPVMDENNLTTRSIVITPNPCDTRPSYSLSSVNDNTSLSSGDERLQMDDIAKNQSTDCERFITHNKPNYSKGRDIKPSSSFRSLNDNRTFCSEDDERMRKVDENSPRSGSSVIASNSFYNRPCYSHGSLNDDLAISSDDEVLQMDEISKNLRPTGITYRDRNITVINKPNYGKRDTIQEDLSSLNNDLALSSEDDEQPEIDEETPNPAGAIVVVPKCPDQRPSLNLRSVKNNLAISCKEYERPELDGITPKAGLIEIAPKLSALSPSYSLPSVNSNVAISCEDYEDPNSKIDEKISKAGSIVIAPKRTAPSPSYSPGSVNDDLAESSNDKGLRMDKIAKNFDSTDENHRGRIMRVINKPNYSKHCPTKPSLGSVTDDLALSSDDDELLEIDEKNPKAGPIVTTSINAKPTAPSYCLDSANDLFTLSSENDKRPKIEGEKPKARSIVIAPNKAKRTVIRPYYINNKTHFDVDKSMKPTNASKPYPNVNIKRYLPKQSVIKRKISDASDFETPQTNKSISNLSHESDQLTLDVQPSIRETNTILDMYENNCSAIDRESYSNKSNQLTKDDGDSSPSVCLESKIVSNSSVSIAKKALKITNPHIIDKKKFEENKLQDVEVNAIKPFSDANKKTKSPESYNLTGLSKLDDRCPVKRLKQNETDLEKESKSKVRMMYSDEQSSKSENKKKYLNDLFGYESDNDDDEQIELSPIRKVVKPIYETSHSIKTNVPVTESIFKLDHDRSYTGLEKHSNMVISKQNVTISPLKPYLKIPSLLDTSSKNMKRKLSFSDPLTSDPEFNYSEPRFDSVAVIHENNVAVPSSDAHYIQKNYKVHPKPVTNDVKTKTTNAKSRFTKISPDSQQHSNVSVRRSRRILKRVSSRSSESESENPQSPSVVSIGPKKYTKKTGSFALRRSPRVPLRPTECESKTTKRGDFPPRKVRRNPQRSVCESENLQSSSVVSTETGIITPRRSRRNPQRSVCESENLQSSSVVSTETGIITPRRCCRNPQRSVCESENLQSTSVVSTETGIITPRKSRRNPQRSVCESENLQSSSVVSTETGIITLRRSRRNPQRSVCESKNLQSSSVVSTETGIITPRRSRRISQRSVCESENLQSSSVVSTETGIITPRRSRRISQGSGYKSGNSRCSIDYSISPKKDPSIAPRRNYRTSLSNTVDRKSSCNKENEIIDSTNGLRRSCRLKRYSFKDFSQKNPDTKLSSSSNANRRDQKRKNSNCFSKRDQSRRMSLPANMFLDTEKAISILRSQSVKNINEIANFSTEPTETKFTLRHKRYMRTINSANSESQKSESESEQNFIKKRSLRSNTFIYANKLNVAPDPIHFEVGAEHTKMSISHSISAASSSDETDKIMTNRNKTTYTIDGNIQIDIHEEEPSDYTIDDQNNEDENVFNLTNPIGKDNQKSHKGSKVKLDGNSPKPENAIENQNKSILRTNNLFDNAIERKQKGRRTKLRKPSSTEETDSSVRYFDSNEEEEEVLNIFLFTSTNVTESDEDSTTVADETEENAYTGNSESECVVTVKDSFENQNKSVFSTQHVFANTANVETKYKNHSVSEKDGKSYRNFENNDTEEVNIFYFTTANATDSDEDSNEITMDADETEETAETGISELENVAEIKSPNVSFYSKNLIDIDQPGSSQSEENYRPKIKVGMYNEIDNYMQPVAYDDAHDQMLDTSGLSKEAVNNIIGIIPDASNDISNTTALSGDDVNHIAGVNSCTCKGTMFEKPRPRSFKKLQVRNANTNLSLELIVHIGHSARKNNQEVILEPIVEYQPELGATKQCEGRLAALAFCLMMRQSATLINVRVDHDNGNVIVVDKMSGEEFVKRHGDRRAEVADRIHTTINQLRFLRAGHYVLSHDWCHSANAMVYSTGVGGDNSFSLRPKGVNLPDAEEALFAKTPPVLEPALLPFHKHRSILPLAFTSLKQHVKIDKNAAAALARANKPPNALKFPKKRKKKKKVQRSE